jgi:imidazolonepropionase-like amidohydrolase
MSARGGGKGTMSARGGGKGTVSARGGFALAAGIAVGVAAVAGGFESAAAQVAIRGEIVHPVAGPPIADGVVLVGADGRIEAVGPAAEVRIPEGTRVLTGAVVTPGLVDGRTVVGLSGHLNVPHDQDQFETSEAIQPELRAFDAYNARELLVEWVRNHGVTTMHTGHAPGPLMSGQTMIVKTRGGTVAEAMVDSVTMVAMTLGPEVAQIMSGRPGTRSRGVAMIRQELVRAEEYARGQAEGAENGSPPARDLRREVLVRVLNGEVRALITAHQASEILTALRLQREFGFDLVLDGGGEAWLVLDEIREAGVPVILHATMARHVGSMEHATFETARILREAGIPVTIQSGFEPYVPKTRVLLFEAGPLLAFGLGFDDVLAMVTLDAARILGIDDRVGSLEPGKDGDVVVYDGDPFEYASRVCAVVIEGEVVSETCH